MLYLKGVSRPLDAIKDLNQDWMDWSIKIPFPSVQYPIPNDLEEASMGRDDHSLPFINTNLTVTNKKYMAQQKLRGLDELPIMKQIRNSKIELSKFENTHSSTMDYPQWNHLYSLQVLAEQFSWRTDSNQYWG